MTDLYAMTYVTAYSRSRNDLVTDLRDISVTAAVALCPLRCAIRVLAASVAHGRWPCGICGALSADVTRRSTRRVGQSLKPAPATQQRDKLHVEWWTIIPLRDNFSVGTLMGLYFLFADWMILPGFHRRDLTVKPVEFFLIHLLWQLPH